MLGVILDSSHKSKMSMRLELIVSLLTILCLAPRSSLANSQVRGNRSFFKSLSLSYFSLTGMTNFLPEADGFIVNRVISPSHNFPNFNSELKAKVGDNLEAFSPEGEFFHIFEDYLEDIGVQTGLEIGDKQRDLLIEALATNTFSMVDYTTNKQLHNKFKKKKRRLIKKWEYETGLKWPRYRKNIYHNKGRKIRSKGDLYDAHHIIECIFSGPSEWWNIHPAATPDEHQHGIHRRHGPAWRVYYVHCQN